MRNQEQIGGPAAAVAQPRVDFRQLRILVLHPRDHDGEVLIRNLQRLGCRVEQSWPPGAALEGDVDVLFCLVDPRSRDYLGPQPRAAVIGIADTGNARTMALLADGNAHAVLCRPIDPAAILTNLVVALNNSRYEKRLLGKVGKLEETLRSVRKVERAKAILMERQKLEEPAAYHFLRQQAMKKRVPIGVVAAAVIESNEVLSSTSS